MTEDPLVIDCRCGVTLTLTVVGVDEWNGIHVSHVDHLALAAHQATHETADSTTYGRDE